MPPNERRSLPARLFRMSPEEEAALHRCLRYGALFMAAAILLILPFIRGGYFRDQARLKQARNLVEAQGYTGCAIRGDGFDPAQFIPLNTPYRPRWTGQSRPDGTFLIGFDYRYRDKLYSHQWEVDLAYKTVKALSDRTKIPARLANGEISCIEP